MQSRVSWQEVVLILGMIVGLVVSGVFAPAVVTVLGGIASTLIGWLVGQAKKNTAPDKQSADPSDDVPTLPRMPAAKPANKEGEQ